jgi:putative transposase
MAGRKIIRLRGFDYSSDNLYYVTSCVHDRICCFGEIVGTTRPGGYKSKSRHMSLNDFGKIAEKQWYWLGEQYPYVILHAFVVMPNHIHGIVEISRRQILERMGRNLTLPRDHPPIKEIKIKSLSELMGAYKTTVSKQIHLMGLTDFMWQRSFHEHIIRDEASYENIIDYIIKNPVNWEYDDHYNIGMYKM